VLGAGVEAAVTSGTRLGLFSLFATIAIAVSAMPSCNCASALGAGKHPDAGVAHPGEGEGEGAGADAGVGCGKNTCDLAHANCGPIGDGCSAILQCGDCTAPEFCGGGGASQCGGNSTTTPGACTPKKCSDIGANCGPLADGCGNVVDCGSCASDQECGTGGANICGPKTGSVCTPSTSCGSANCGPVSDGCGGLTASCGTCSNGDICGGAGVASECGGGGGTGPTCTNLCANQQQQASTCGGTNTTTISGTVFAPNGQEPIYDALVYIPNGTVDAIPDGISGQCLTCNAQASGDPISQVITGPDGKFKLTNAPAGSNIPVVIQLGFWRRQITIQTVTACQDNPQPVSLTSLPHREGTNGNAGEGDIPLTAMVTGAVDTLECVLRKIGVDDDQFGNPSTSTRIQFFQQNGSVIDGSTPQAQDALWDKQEDINKYDQVLFACEGHPNEKPGPGPGTAQGFVQQYANLGGRVFATHYSYVWLYENDPWGCSAPGKGSGTPDCTTAGHTIAAWDADQDHSSPNTITSTVDTTFQKGSDFSKWMDVVGASTSPGSGQMSINVWRRDLDAVIAPAQRWLFTTDPNPANMIQHLTFNTPVDAPVDQQCGRVLYSDFHVSDTQAQTNTFPDECNGGSLSPQEKVLEFMLFDLASCIAPDTGPQPASCTAATTCAAQGANCGSIPDGCGGTLDCGQCTAPAFCGGGGANKCGGAGCTQETCSSQSLACGLAGDGCGGQLSCGDCPAGQTCGGGGTPGQCGTGACTPTTCAAAHANCGPIADGCGGTIDCGTCPGGNAFCGQQTANQCGILGG
jgi:hypothetical protein